jgi:hypothetical protein
LLHVSTTKGHYHSCLMMTHRGSNIWHFYIKTNNVCRIKILVLTASSLVCNCTFNFLYICTHKHTEVNPSAFLNESVMDLSQGHGPKIDMILNVFRICELVFIIFMSAFPRHIAFQWGCENEVFRLSNCRTH